MAIWRTFQCKCFGKFSQLITHRYFIFRQYNAVSLKSNTYDCTRTLLNRKRTNHLTKKCFSDKPGEPRSLSIVVSRGPLQWISNKVKLFLVNSYFDADFDEQTFLHGAKQVVILSSGACPAWLHPLVNTPVWKFVSCNRVNSKFSKSQARNLQSFQPGQYYSSSPYAHECGPLHGVTRYGVPFMGL